MTTPNLRSSCAYKVISIYVALMLVFFEFHSTKYLNDLGDSRIEHRLDNASRLMMYSVSSTRFSKF